MRVIAGKARRLPLKTVPGMDTRPTTDRIKETLFNILQPELADCRFLDLFSGSGGIGIEAISRGASEAVFVEKNPNAKIYYATTKALKTYTDVQYEDDCYIMFGKESAGIPEEILMEHKENCIRIPMINDIRSLNLSNSVAIVLYEALRQNQFDHMQLKGQLHNHTWE